MSPDPPIGTNFELSVVFAPPRGGAKRRRALRDKQRRQAPGHVPKRRSGRRGARRFVSATRPLFWALSRSSAVADPADDLTPARSSGGGQPFDSGGDGSAAIHQSSGAGHVPVRSGSSSSALPRKSFTGIEPGPLVDLRAPVSMYARRRIYVHESRVDFLGILAVLIRASILSAPVAYCRRRSASSPRADGRTPRARGSS